MMEIAPTNYLPVLGLEDSTFFEQYPMDSFACPLDDFDFDFESFSASPEDNSSYQFNSKSTPNCFPGESLDRSLNPAKPTKRLQTFSTINNRASDLFSHKVSASPSSQLISFGNFNASSHISQQFNNLDSYVKPKIEDTCCENMDFAAFIAPGSYEDKSFLSSDNKMNQVGMTPRNPIQAQEHVLAERKRREKLSQRFIALSAILPGLKKMDKASVLGDAIKYVKQLQQRVQTLEEQAEKRTVGSSILVKKSIIFDEDNKNFDSHCDHSFPKIEVRVSGKDVLIRAQSEKYSGCATIILSELEKLHFVVQSSSFLPFGNNNIDVTIIAQMNEENCITAKDLLRRLRQVSRQLI